MTTAEGVNFAPTGLPIEKVTPGGARIFLCDVCGSFDELLALARERVTRELTPEERATYLGTGS